MPVLLKSLLGPSKLATSRPNQWSTTQLPVLFRGREATSGATVTDESALTISSVFSGVSLLSEIMGWLPFGVYRRQSDGGKMEAVSHPASNVLATRPNPWMTAKQARQVLEWNRRLGGNGYAEIQWTGGGNVAAYWPLGYWRVQIKWEADGSDFHYIVDGKRRVEKEDMIHIPLTSWDGICGQSFLDYAVESIGLGITQQQAAAYFFANGGRPDGVLKHKLDPGDKQRERFRQTWSDVHGGASGRGKVGVLWGGWEYQDTQFITPEQQQALESRRFSTEEVARWLKIPPHLLADLSRATFSNIEAQGISFVVFTMSSMLVDYEQEFDRKLLNPPQLYCKHNVNALMRGDSAARSAFYKDLRGMGVASANDICKLEDMDPIGPDGDLRFIPANWLTYEKAQAPAPTPAALPPAPGSDGSTPPDPGGIGPGSDQPGGGNDPSSGLAATQAWAADAFKRMLRKESNAANRAAAQPDKFLDWLDSFYAGHAETMAAALSPVIAFMPVGTDPAKAASAAKQYCERSHSVLLEMTGHATNATLAPAVAKIMSEWETSRPAVEAAAFCEVKDADS